MGSVYTMTKEQMKELGKELKWLNQNVYKFMNLANCTSAIQMTNFVFNFLPQTLTDMSTTLSLRREIICKPRGKLHVIFHSKSLKQNTLFTVRIEGLENYLAI